MRIAVVLTASTGGIGRHVASLLPRLAGRGHEVEVFCPPGTAVAHHFAALGVRHHPLTALARVRRADVVHAHGYKAGVLAAAAVARGGPALVVTWHNAILPGSSWRSAAGGRLLQRFVARAADLTLGASSDLVAEARRLGARSVRLGPVAAPELAPPSGDRDELRDGLGWGPADVVVLTVSRLAPQKNLGMVLDVAARRERPELRFVIAGDGPERTTLERRIAAEELPVELLGRSDQVVDLLAAADLALLTSTWEARALVAQEALLAGLPLVSTRVGGIAELVGEAALLVELGDVAGAAHAVGRLADDPVVRQRLREAGLARAATWPDEEDAAEDVLAAYTDVLSLSDIRWGRAHLRSRPPARPPPSGPGSARDEP